MKSENLQTENILKTEINSTVSAATFESAIMHLQKINKRLTIITVIALVLMSLMTSMFIYFFYNFDITSEVVSIDSGNGNANYVGNDGDIINGSDQREESDN